VSFIRQCLIEPTAELRDWDYGEKGQQYLCWIVFERDSCEIAFCENGFGPRTPWGLLWPLDHSHSSMGMDSGWYKTFMETFFDSYAVRELPIWRVFKIGVDKAMEPVSEEGSWEETWEKIFTLRVSDPQNRYHCDNSIAIACRERTQ
jgi:hypothetical protein